MAKAVAVIIDNSYNTDTGAVDLFVGVIIRDAPNIGGGTRLNVIVPIQGTENPLQINNAIRDKVKADALAIGVTLLDTDITSTKFS